MERFLFSKVSTWLVLLLAMLGIAGAVYFGTIVMNETRARTSPEFGAKYSWVGDAAYSVADFPNFLRDTLKPDGEPRAADLSARLADLPGGWTRHGDTSGISGYLLLSRIDRDVDLSVAELVDLSTLEVVHRWEPDAEALLADAPRTSKLISFTEWTNHRFRVMHPILMPDGRFLFHGQFSPLIALSACGEMQWRQDGAILHHSLNVDADGNFWAPALLEPTKIAKVEGFRDDALTQISPEGEILFQKSLAQILIENGRTDLIWQNIIADPMHTNDIQPVLADGPYWKKGDLFVSARHRSLALLYRPSTDKIVWLKQGPWLTQHDIDMLDDHRIAIFNNNVINKGNGGFIPDNSDVRIYDFRTGEVSNPYADAMGKDLGENRVIADTNGLMEFTESGHMIVEEDTSGRMLIYAPDRSLVAEYVNKARTGRIYRMAWSRYMTREDGDSALAAVRACPGANG
ncbi:MAG: hypothetical protein KDE03_02140 [Rhodobacteraceae bacterium]|nr:hypothetical protein [Paracoccaceae bacterium]